MSTTQANDEALLADTEKTDEQIVMATLTTGAPIPVEVAERVRERARRIRERIAKEHGLLDIAVPAIREFRER
jgi:hypothetical protein